MMRGWVEGRADLYGGSSDLFTRFDNRIGLGIEGGLELFNVTLFGEALMMGTDQWLMTANLGLDTSFGSNVRLTIGAYTGPVLMVFPESQAPSGTDLSGLPAEQQQVLIQATGKATLDEVEAELDLYGEEQDDLGRMAFGWNIIRARAAVDLRLMPAVYLGIAGQVGYHLLISGEAVAAGAKNEAVDKFAKSYGIDASSELVGELRTAVGASPVDKGSLDGFNYDLHAYIRLEL